jgi:hypothetical protein
MGEHKEAAALIKSTAVNVFNYFLASNNAPYTQKLDHLTYDMTARICGTVHF